MATRISKNTQERLANIITKLTLADDLENARQGIALLAAYTNVQRLPGEDGQPGFGRGWGFGDPYEDYGYGEAPAADSIPNTGDLPLSFQEQLEKNEEEEGDLDAKLADLQQDDPNNIAVPEENIFDPDDFNLEVVIDETYKEVKEKGDAKKAAFESKDSVPDEDSAELADDIDISELDDDIYYDPNEFDMDVVFAQAINKVATVLGRKEARSFAQLFGVLGIEKVAQEEEEVEEDVKKPRARRDVMLVWKEDLIPDIIPIIRRVLKHVSVQYSLPYASLTNALRAADSPVAGLLADALDGVAPASESESED